MTYLYIFDYNEYDWCEHLIIFAETIDEATILAGKAIDDFKPRTRKKGWGKGWSIAEQFEVKKGLQTRLNQYHRIAKNQWELVEEEAKEEPK